MRIVIFDSLFIYLKTNNKVIYQTLAGIPFQNLLIKIPQLSYKTIHTVYRQ